MFILGGLSWITSSGEREKVEKAKKQMTSAAIGLIIVVASYSIAFIIGTVLLIMLIIDGVNVQISWLRHIATAVSVLLLILAAFDKWLWKLPILNGWFAKRPDLNGTWKVVIQTDWEDPETGEIIGRRSPDDKQEWRIDRKGHPGYNEPPHVNWKNWGKGKKEGGYGHVYY